MQPGVATYDRRMMSRVAIVVGSVCTLVGCQANPQPERRVDVSNVGYQLNQLFTDDRGYAVYRFRDQGDWRYYVVGPDGQSQMLPTTRVVREPNATIYPGFGVGGGRIDRRHR